MITLLSLRNIFHRPWRSLLLFVGFGVGVGVMITLLSVGEALLTQARNEKLIGGGNVTVLPEGLDIEVMRTGGVGGLFFSIDHSRFIYRQILASERLRQVITAATPQIEGRLLYIRTHGGKEFPVRGLGEVPSATLAVGGAPGLASGTWINDDGDRKWISPTLFELRNDVDHFHTPASDSTWAEWHYFNLLSNDRQRWTFISFIVGKLGSRITVTTQTQGGKAQKYNWDMPLGVTRFSTTDANLVLGNSSVTVLPNGDYSVKVRGAVNADLTVTPVAGAYFPPASLSGDERFISGYTVPALRASATGTVCINGKCEQFNSAQAYHDHNWGVWRGVTWDWGASRAGQYTFLYGRVYPPDSVATAPPLVVYLTDSLGFRAVLRPREITYNDGRTVTVGNKTIRVPSTATMWDTRNGDTLQIKLFVEDATATDTYTAPAHGTARPYFIQMKGTARISGRIGGEKIQGEGSGFFETYR